MRWLLNGLVTLILLLTLVGIPAPHTITPEVLILVGSIFVLALSCTYSAKIADNPTNVLVQSKPLLLTLFIYLALWLISGIIGFIHGVSLLEGIRSTAPYLAFIPFILICLCNKREVSTKDILYILIFLGVLQSLYHFYLYFSDDVDRSYLVGALYGRITQVDNRVTIPIFLGAAILPLSLMMTTKNIIVYILYGVICILGLLAAVLSFTRAMVFSVFVGWMATIFLTWMYKKIEGVVIIKKLGLRVLGFILLILFSLTLLYQFPVFKIATKALMLRTNSSVDIYKQASLFLSLTLTNQEKDSIMLASSKSASPRQQTDTLGRYSTGRFDEWMPAFEQWQHAKPLNLFFGIGSGMRFNMKYHQHQTYVHNLALNNLIYTGILGLIATLLFWFLLLRTIIMKTILTFDYSYIAFASLLLGLLFYAEFFAVHKLLSFNAILFLLTALALQPVADSKFRSLSTKKKLCVA